MAHKKKPHMKEKEMKAKEMPHKKEMSCASAKGVAGMKKAKKK